MRKIALLTALIVLMTTPIAANPTPRLLGIEYQLTFSGTTANCECWVRDDSPSAYLVVTMKLWSGNTVLKEWSQAGTQSVSLNQTATVTKGKDYTLTIDVMVNGILKPRQSITRTC